MESEDAHLLPAEQILPSKLPLIILHGNPIFPGILTPIMLSRDQELASIEYAQNNTAMHIGFVLSRDPDDDDDTAEGLFTMGTVAKIIKRINLPDNGVNIFISTIKRFRIKKFSTTKHNIPTAVVEYPEEPTKLTMEVRAMVRSLISEMKQLAENNQLFSEEVRLNMANITNIEQPGRITDFIASILNIEREGQQEILETLNIRRRMERVLVLIKKEQEIVRIQKKIQKQIGEKIEKSQREYFLREQLKEIQKELGISTDAVSSDYNNFKKKIDALDLAPEVREIVDQELEKFSLLEPNSSEFAVVRNYLDLIASLPWNDEESSDPDISEAMKILDKDHYGLDDIKQRIVEFLSVHLRTNKTKSSILCFVGPPGVGKTSVGKSIASALGKKFFRFSVGGMRDEAEIKGHRRTYVGAMPGKIIQGLKYTKSKEPVFMIDEIDKLGSSYQGDPSSALLEVLDSEQNAQFRDHYLDIPFDVSRVFFITTANTLDSIPSALLDRMEVIQLSGYIDSEKIAIAKKYLLPKSLLNHGLKTREISYSMAALRAIAENYARDAGLRNYEKALNRINRKVTYNIAVHEASTPVKVDAGDLQGYLGQARFNPNKQLSIVSPGICNGLAWTTFGGEVMKIESIFYPGKGGIQLTGQMGNVMQESAQIAYSYIQSIAKERKVDAEIFKKYSVHLHIPAGATPKDGPSAGITMATSLFSLLSGKKTKANFAMTGELSLSGEVLPIGGLKEKTIAAIRNKIKNIIIPSENDRDVQEIPDHIRKGVVYHPVNTMNEVLDTIMMKK